MSELDKTIESLRTRNKELGVMARNIQKHRIIDEIAKLNMSINEYINNVESIDISIQKELIIHFEKQISLIKKLFIKLNKSDEKDIQKLMIEFNDIEQKFDYIKIYYNKYVMYDELEHKIRNIVIQIKSLIVYINEHSINESLDAINYMNKLVNSVQLLITDVYDFIEKNITNDTYRSKYCEVIKPWHGRLDKLKKIVNEHYTKYKTKETLNKKPDNIEFIPVDDTKFIPVDDTKFIPVDDTKFIPVDDNTNYIDNDIVHSIINNTDRSMVNDIFGSNIKYKPFTNIDR
jgi:hypothetical protein